MNTYAWLFRREFWENRSIVWIPAAIGALLLVIALFGHFELMDLPVHADAQPGGRIGAVMLIGFGAVFFAVMSIYTTWYLLDCLHADRKDKSVLFWKSLPITDTDTVLSKLLMGSIVIPLVYFFAADIATLGTAFVLSVRSGATAMTDLWHIDIWLQLQVLWIYIIVTQALWFLPLSGWLMLVSAWARRAPAMWAILPPLGLIYLEYKLTNTSVVGRFLLDRVADYVPRAFHAGADGGYGLQGHIGSSDVDTPINVWQLINPQGFFLHSSLWVGVVIGAALTAAAIVVRHRRSEA